VMSFRREDNNSNILGKNSLQAKLKTKPGKTHTVFKEKHKVPEYSGF